jgi:prophage tail gpP-like protein
MARRYSVKTGDTLNKISFLFYGRGSEAPRIQKANSFVKNPNQLVPGWILNIPDIPGETDQLKPPAASLIGDEDNVLITIDGKEFARWDQVVLTRSMDAMSTFQFFTPFDPTNEQQVNTFKPFSYKPATIHFGSGKVLTGTIMNINPSSSDNAKTLTISGYSLPGVLADCTMPVASYPLEFKNVDLQQIVNTLLQPFSIKSFFADDKGATFKQVTLPPTQRIYDFLIQLAQQRSLIITSNGDGELVFQKATTEASDATLIDGEFPVASGSTINYDGRKRFSDMAALGDGWDEGDGQNSVVNDPTIPVSRPFAFQATDVSPGDLETAAKAQLGFNNANAIEINLPINSWRTKDGVFFRENQKITFQSDALMIYNPTEFIIRSITYNRNAESQTALLKLVFPEAFTGEVRSSYPWD